MLHTLIIGMGRSGIGLHWPVLHRLKSDPLHRSLFSPEPPLGWDVRGDAAAVPPGVKVIRVLEHAPDLIDPACTVVHVCTPPQQRVDTVRRLAELGFRRLLIEKPLAGDAAAAQTIAELRTTLGLEIIVVAPWLDSELTRRARDLIESGRLGELRTMSFAQRKPRFQRTLRSTENLTVFDVEPPHSVGVALSLAGDAEVAAASWSDMRVDQSVVPTMGAGRLTLRHAATRTRIFSNLTALVRERRLTLQFTGGRFVGHYPASENDPFACTVISTPAGVAENHFVDDSLTEFILRVYRRFAEKDETDRDFALNLRVVRLLDDAKAICRGSGLGGPPNGLPTFKVVPSNA